MLDAGDELAVAGVNLDDLALVEVHGDLDDSAGVDRGRLGGTLDGVALKARVGLDDGGLDEHRRGYAHELIVGEEQLADVVLAQPLGVLAHHVLGNGNLLIGLVVHEDVVGAVVVEVLELTGGEHDALELGAGVAGVLDDAAALDVAGLVAHKCAALARLDMLELDDGVDLVLNAETEAVLEVGGRNGRHIDLSCYGQNAQASKLHTTKIIHLQTAPAASA